MGWCPSEQQKSLLAQRVRKLANVKWNWSKIDSFELDRKIFDQWSDDDRRAPHWGDDETTSRASSSSQAGHQQTPGGDTGQEETQN